MCLSFSADRYMKIQMYGNGSEIRKEVVPTPVEGRPFSDKRKFGIVR